MSQQNDDLEAKLEETNTVRGFKALSYMADLLARTDFNLKGVRGDLIYHDKLNDIKLRRKAYKGVSTPQNDVFEAYRQVDGQQKILAELNVGDDTISSSVHTAMIAAKEHNKMMEDGHTVLQDAAIHLLKLATALLQEKQVVDGALKSTLNPTDDPNLAEYYKNLSALHARSYIVTAMSDLFALGVGDVGGNNDLASNMEFLKKVDPEIHGEGATEEYHDALNMLFSAMVGFRYSKVVNDLIIMAEETQANIAEAAKMELDSGEQK